MPVDDRAPRGALTLGRVFGAQLIIRPGLLVLSVALIALVGPRLDRANVPDPYLVAAALVVGLYVSIFLHELAHVVAARAYGMEVTSVTLHLLGGETLIRGESRTPSQEAVTSASGPVVSLMLAAGGLLAAAQIEGGSTRLVIETVGWLNVAVGLFNLLPGLPLDGGRVLRAVVWGATGREITGIRVAARVGQVASLATAGLGLYRIATGGFPGVIDAAVCTLVSLFLWQGAVQSLAVVDRARRIDGLQASNLMVQSPGLEVDPEWETLPRLNRDLSGTALLRAVSREPADRYLVVDADGEPVGVLDLDDVTAAYRKDQS